MLVCLLNIGNKINEEYIYKRMKMNKRVLSMIGGAAFCCMVTTSVIQTEASETELRKVDGSYLTTEDSSTGTTANGMEKGIHLMTGDCTISKAGRGKVYAYASTTANHEVNYIATIVYVDRYLEDVDEWGYVTSWMEDVENDVYMSTAKTVYVDGGYFYRVRARHIAGNESPYEETASVTNGIWVN